MHNNKYNCQEIINTCKRKANTEIRSKKHNIIKILLDGKVVAGTTIAHGRNTLPKGTYQSVAKGLRLSVEELDQFLECTYSKEMYEKKLKNHIE